MAVLPSASAFRLHMQADCMFPRTRTENKIKDKKLKSTHSSVVNSGI